MAGLCRLVQCDSMRLSMYQLNPTIGDVSGNTEKIINALQSDDAELVITPEMSICGYPPRDLLHCTGFVRACEEAVVKIASQSHGKTVLVGHPSWNTTTGKVRNSVSVLQNGEVIARCDKQLLPNYDVFDEPSS